MSPTSLRLQWATIKHSNRYHTLQHTAVHPMALLRTLYTTLHCTVLHYTTLHHSALHYTTRHYATLYYTTSHCTTLHYTTRHYHAILYYITLHYTTPRRSNEKFSPNLNHIFSILSFETEFTRKFLLTFFPFCSVPFLAFYSI